jgi:hypothetical protein
MSKLNAQKYDLDMAFAAFAPVGHSPGPGAPTGQQGRAAAGLSVRT